MATATGKDLLEYGLRRANELKVEQNDDFVPDLKDYTNLAYWDIVGEFPWLWAIKYPPPQVTMARPVTLSVAQAVEGSDAVVLGSDPGHVVGYKFVMQDDVFPMRIIAQVGLTLTLSGVYPATRAGVGCAYKDEYTLPDDILIPTQMKRLRGGDLELMTPELLATQYGQNTASGKPQAYAFLTDRIVQIAPWPEEPDPLEFWYTALPPALDFSGSAATDTPILPVIIRWVIPDRALYYLLTDMEDPKAPAIIANSSVRLSQEKDRHATKWKPQFWIPSQYRIARNR